MQDQIKFLNISDRIFEKYRCLVRNNINCTKEECRKKLTRDFIVLERTPVTLAMG